MCIGPRRSRSNWPAKAGIVGDQRHAYATLLLEQGEDLGVVSRILGHSNIATTSDVYAHFTRSLSARAAVRMDEVLSPTGTARNA